ncbi:MAG: PAS domain S-box protein [Rhizobiales bacterium]|nr:PAS domain S-box protein [Hyphomicrobiales bacterium]
MSDRVRSSPSSPGDAGVTLTREELERTVQDLQASNAALASTNNDLRNLLISMQIATIFLDAEGRIRSFTPAATELFDLASRNLGRSLGELSHRFERLPPSPPGEQLANGNAVEDAVRHKDGRWFLRRVVVYESGRGLPEGSLVTFIDISAQSMAEMAHRASEAKYQSLLGSIDEGFCLIRMLFDEADRPVDYVFLEINAAFEKQTGLKDALGKSMRALIPDHEDHWFEIYGEIARTGEPRRFVERSAPLNKWFDVYAFRHGDAAEHVVAVIFKDISEQRRIGHELAVREARYRTLFEQASVGIAKVAFDGSWIRVNSRLCEILGYSSEELLERNLLALTHPEDRGLSIESLGRLKAGETDSLQLEKRYVRKDGSIIWCHVSTVRHADNDGEAAFLVSVVEDIDARKKAEATRELLIDELNHRVRNMLTVVKSIASQTLRHSSSLDDFSRAFEGRVQALATTHTLLSDNKWQGSPLQALLERQLHHASGKSAFTLEGPALSLTPKRSLALSMVFHELSTNAVKYGALSNGDGHVVVRWNLSDQKRTEPGKELHLVWRESGGPPVLRPTRTGFGTKLIDVNIAHEFGGRIDRAYDRAGLIVSIHIPWVDEVAPKR